MFNEDIEVRNTEHAGISSCFMQPSLGLCGVKTCAEPSAQVVNSKPRDQASHMMQPGEQCPKYLRFFMLDFKLTFIH